MSKDKEYIGPIYGVELLKDLPLVRGLANQALPTRADLLNVAMRPEVTVSGYEVLTAHYRASLDEIARLKGIIRDIAHGGEWSPTTLQEAIGDLK